MLCYRCGSYTPDGSRKCHVCGQALAAQRRSTHNLSQSKSGSRVVPPYETGSLVAGRYRVGAQGVLGSAGWVMRARDEEVDVDIAIKFIAPNLLQSDEDKQVFLKAVKAAHKLHHANIVRIYDQGMDEKNVYYTMPYLEGLSLRRIIDLRVEKSQVFTIEETMPLVGQLTTAVDSLVAFGPHAAIRPNNIMVLPDVLKLTGVPHWKGLPRRPFLALQTQTKASDYLAPEVLREATDTDRRADIYSIGVIIAEMLTGKVYAREQTSWEQAGQQLPRKLWAALLSALAEQPDGRFSTGAAFFEAMAESVASPSTNLPLPTALDGSEETPPSAPFTFEHALAPSSKNEDVVQPEAAPPVLLGPTLAEQVRGTALPSNGVRRKKQSSALPPVVWFLFLLTGILVVAVAWVWYERQRSGLRTLDDIEVPQESAPEAQPIAPEPTLQPLPKGEKVDASKTSEVKPAAPEVVEQEFGNLVGPAEPSKTKKATRTCPNGMLLVEGGRFRMGSEIDDKQRGFDDLVAGDVLSESFCMDIYEFPNEAGKIPVAKVTYAKAKKTCEKLGRRLCTETEWEHACKGKKNWRFPFGAQFSAGVCNVGEDAETKLEASGAFSQCKSAFGISDMSGNVAEWTSTPWSKDLSEKVIKGGAASHGTYGVRCAARANETALGSLENIGFRCCADF